MYCCAFFLFPSKASVASFSIVSRSWDDFFVIDSSEPPAATPEASSSSCAFAAADIARPFA